MLLPPALASSMMGSVSGLQTGPGIELLWQSICNYIDTNGMVACTWAAVSTTFPPTPDPLVSVTGNVITAAGRSLTPYLTGIDQLTDCSAVLGMLSMAMNLATLQWKVMLPPTMGFVTAPGTVIAPATISLTPSMATDTLTAFTLMSSQIIAGLSTVSFTPSSGFHAIIYSGVGVYIPGIH